MKVEGIDTGYCIEVADKAFYVPVEVFKEHHRILIELSIARAKVNRLKRIQDMLLDDLGVPK